MHAAVLAVLFALVSPLLVAPTAHADVEPLPTEVYGGAWPTSHVQGIAIDKKEGHMYFSFTQMLVKTDLQGNVVGTVEGLTGHLGDIDFNPKDGRVYGSLEYKDAESFYIAMFDGDEITRTGMDAESDGVMSTVYLEEVVDDFTADMDGDGKFDGDVADTPDHRYGCSGIDGVSFGPEFGKRKGKQKLTVAYGIYSNIDRQDNDHQVLLQYDVNQWHKYEQPLTQSKPHTSGPGEAAGKYFAYTGNTTYGVQNLEYDAHTGDWFMAVYEGKKEQFPNYPFFIIDGSKSPEKGLIRGQEEPEQGLLLPLLEEGLYDGDTGIYGWDFSGEFGLTSLDDGYYYVADDGEIEEDGVQKETGTAELHRWTGEIPTPFEKVATAQ